jgi:predicted nucleic acid-binding protein
MDAIGARGQSELEDATGDVPGGAAIPHSEQAVLESHTWREHVHIIEISPLAEGEAGLVAVANPRLSFHPHLCGIRGHQLILSLAGGSRRGVLAENSVWMSIINLGEVVYIIEREQGLLATRKALAAIEQLPIALIDVNPSLTLAAAHIKAQFPLAYADTFAVALGQQENARVVTGDPEFKAVESLVAIEWLPR